MDNLTPLQKTLNELHDVIPPGPFSLWPPAPGWWLLAGLVLLVLALLIWRLWRYLAPLQRRRRLLAKLPPLHHDGQDYQRLSRWLKQVARHCYPEENSGPLSGDEWLDFLYHKASDLGREPLQKLLHSALTPTPQLSPEQARQLAADWLRRQPC
ncbi:MAG: DUF4381 domain-containing protein [Halomonadaceae bacterium]|nr:MAG: DUF4381 domain-containing protein [Halomonadaceae bacterium]